MYMKYTCFILNMHLILWWEMRENETQLKCANKDWAQKLRENFSFKGSEESVKHLFDRMIKLF